jgi:hypothetical protein
VDVFVFYDDVQYDRRGWRNRNRIRTPQGTRWLTIPVHAKGAQTVGIPINTIATAGTEWARQHREALERSYQGAPFFSVYEEWLRNVFSTPPPLLADFTIPLIQDIAGKLGIHQTRFLRSSQLGVTGVKTERLLAVMKKVGATEYLSGPTARTYLDEELLAESGVAVEWMTYDYPEYPQLDPPFDPFVSVLDLLFMTGERAPRYIWGSD